MTEHTHVAIVGAGITGLAIADSLRRRGIPHVVLEAADRVGGVIRSGLVDGSLLEWGPQRTRLTAPVRGLVESLGIADQVITAPAGLPLYVYSRGRLRAVPFSLAEFLRSDIVPLTSKLRALAEPLTAGADPEETVASYFTRKLGQRLYENLAGPLYGGLYASDPADMIVGLSLGHVLRELNVGRSLGLTFLRRGGAVDPPPACSFESGMETLPLALHAANSRNVWLESPVHGIWRHPGGWELPTGSGSVVAERVVVTAAAGVTARLLANEFPVAAEAIGTLTYNPLAIVHLRAETDLHGLGYQVSLGEQMATRGVTFNDSLFGREGVYTVYLGGARAPQVVGWTDEALATTAIREFRQVTGYDGMALYVDHERMPAWDRSWSALERVTLPPTVQLASNWSARPGIPGRLAQARRIADGIAAEFADNPSQAL